MSARALEVGNEILNHRAQAVRAQHCYLIGARRRGQRQNGEGDRRGTSKQCGAAASTVHKFLGELGELGGELTPQGRGNGGILSAGSRGSISSRIAR
jgi:hypothetical protein